MCPNSFDAGMSTTPERSEALAVDIHFTVDQMSVRLSDGRVLTVPLAWYPRLANAAPHQRRCWRLIGGGVGVHWPEIDEDLSVQGMLEGRRAKV